MSYELFFHLVRTQATLRRALGRTRPERRDVIARAIAAIHDRLLACDRYEAYLRLMAGGPAPLRA